MAESLGQQRGGFLYLYPKSTGVEPGFIGLRIAGLKETLDAVIEETLGEEKQADESLVYDRYVLLSEEEKSDLTSMARHFFEKIQDEGSRRSIPPYGKKLLAKLNEKGYPCIMVKRDYPDGKNMSVHLDSAMQINGIRTVGKKFGRHFQKIVASGYVLYRNSPYKVVSLGTFSEYVVTEKIARQILGPTRVQECFLVDRENALGEGKVDHMYALGIALNPNFEPFGDTFNDGQRVECHNPGIAVETEWLGETFALQVAFGNYDAFGPFGDNCGFDRTNNECYVIDLGLALSKKSRLIGRVNSLLLLDQGRHAENFSIYENTSLVSRVKGLLLLNRALGNSIENEAAIVGSFGEGFARHYDSLGNVNEILDGFFQTGRFYESDAAAYIRNGKKIQCIFNKNANKLLKMHSQYLAMSCQEIDIVEGLIKVGVGRACLSAQSVNQKVKLNRLRCTVYEKLPVFSVSRQDDRIRFNFDGSSKNKENIIEFLEESKTDYTETAEGFDFNEYDIKKLHTCLSDNGLRAYFNLDCEIKSEMDDNVIDILNEAFDSIYTIKNQVYFFKPGKYASIDALLRFCHGRSEV